MKTMQILKALSCVVIMLSVLEAASAAAKARRPEEVPEMIRHLDISRQCNMGLTDKVAEDKQGGWTDQGENDIRYLPVGVHQFAGIPFNVIDPDKNDGKSVIALQGEYRDYFPQETDWIKVNSDFLMLYVLHGVAWVADGSEPYAHMVLRYEDGQEVVVPFRTGQEADDWHKAQATGNGPLAWVGRNDVQSPVGLHLFAWHNTRIGTWLDAVKFVSANRSEVPLVLGVTLTAAEFEITEPNRQLRGIDLSTAIVKYRARVPLCREFGAMQEQDITVSRIIPEQARNIQSLDVHLRFADVVKGCVEVTIFGKTVAKDIAEQEWTTKLTVDDPAAMQAIRDAEGRFDVHLKMSDGIRLGRYRFDTSPNVIWAPNGQDSENVLAAITYEAHFLTDDLKLAKWGHLMLTPEKREKPEASTEQKSGIPVGVVNTDPRATLILNGEWELASASPETMPDTYPAIVRVPGFWYMNVGRDVRADLGDPEKRIGLSSRDFGGGGPPVLPVGFGLTEKELETHSMWYRTRFLVPPSFDEKSNINLHFRMVAYKATVYVNGTKVGEHLGDIDPFAFDINGVVKRGGWNELVVCVEDHQKYFKPVSRKLTLDPATMFGHQIGKYLYQFNFGPDRYLGPTNQDIPGGSTVVVYEDGKPLAAPHSPTWDIQEYGKGRYNHWGPKRGQVLYMSTSDNTDPRTNGRTYVLEYTALVPDRLTQRLDYDFNPADKTMARYAGILKDVYLEAVPPDRIDDVFVQTSVRNKTIQVTYELSGDVNGAAGHLVSEIWKNGQKVKELPVVKIDAATASPLTISQPWPEPRLWDINDPYLYFLKSEWRDENGRLVDRVHTRFGFREFWTRGTDLVLNGRKIRIQGDSPHTFNYLIHCRHHLYNRIEAQYYRTLNCNLLRQHLSSMNAETFVDAMDEVGVLATLEPTFVPFEWIYDDVSGQVVWERTEIVKQQYRDWARRYRNSPSVVMYDIYNEFWSRKITDPNKIVMLRKQLKVLEALNAIVRKEDPTRLTTLHGAEGVYHQDGAPWTAVTNMHYQWHSDHTRNWKTEMKGRPLIIGEFEYEGVWSHFNSNLRIARQKGEDWRDLYWEKINAASRTLARYADLYLGRDISGIMPYHLNQWITHPEDPRGFEHAMVNIPWPALSGPGQKPMYGEVHMSLTHFNWWDPNWQCVPQSPVSDTMHDKFEPQPLPSFTTFRPEIIIEVYKDGKAVSNVPVILHPTEGQAAEPAGCVTDADGKAWILVPEEGQYKAVIKTENQIYSVTVKPEQAKEYSVIKIVRVDL